jgi:hypothetical protein
MPEISMRSPLRRGAEATDSGLGGDRRCIWRPAGAGEGGAMGLRRRGGGGGGGGVAGVWEERRQEVDAVVGAAGGGGLEREGFSHRYFRWIFWTGSECRYCRM